MDAREMTLSAMDGIPGHVPFNPFIMHLAASVIGVDYAREYCRDPELIARGQLACARKFGIQHVNVSTDAYREASAWGVKLNFDAHTPMPANGGTLDWRQFNGIETPDLASAPRVQERVEAVRLLKKTAPDLPVFGWVEAPLAELVSLFGMMDVVSIINRQGGESIIKQLLDRILPIQLEFARMQIEAGADVIGAGDSAVSQFGPKHYKALTLGPTTKLVKALSRDVPVVYHVCGDNSGIDKDGNDMLLLIASTGATMVDIDTEVDLAKAKQKIGKDTCLRGNTSTSLLGSAVFDTDRIIDAVTKTVLDGKPGGRYMFGAGCEFPWAPFDLAARNLAICKEAVDKHGSYD